MGAGRDEIIAFGSTFRQNSALAACLLQRDKAERFLQSLGHHVVTWCGRGNLHLKGSWAVRVEVLGMEDVRGSGLHLSF